MFGAILGFVAVVAAMAPKLKGMEQLKELNASSGKLGHGAAQAVMDQLTRWEKKGWAFPKQHYKSLSASDKVPFAMKLYLDKDGSFLKAIEKEPRVG